MSIMTDPGTMLETHTSVGGIGTPRWSAPEVLDPPSFGFKYCQPSKESDCYSLGMTIYEVRAFITFLATDLILERSSPESCRFTT